MKIATSILFIAVLKSVLKILTDKNWFTILLWYPSNFVTILLYDKHSAAVYHREVPSNKIFGRINQLKNNKLAWMAYQWDLSLSFFSAATPLSLSRTLEGAFWADTLPFKGHEPFLVHWYAQKYKDHSGVLWPQIFQDTVNEQLIHTTIVCLEKIQILGARAHLYSPLCHTKFGLVKRENLPGARWASSENCQTFRANDPQIAVLFPSSQKTSINWTILWNKKDGLEYMNIFCHNFAWSWSNFAVNPKLNL